MRKYFYLFTTLFSLFLISNIYGVGDSPAATAAGNPTGIGSGNLLPEELSEGLDNTMNEINDEFKKAVAPWTAQVRILAKRLFYMLIGLDFAWMVIKLILKKNFLEDVAQQVVKKIFLYGIGWLLILKGDDYLRHAFNFFKDSSYTISSTNSAAGADANLNVGNFFDTSIGMINKLYTSFLNDSNVNGIGAAGFIAGLGKIILIIGMAILIAYISSQIIVAYAEMYMTITATIVLFGFFVTDWTREITQRSIMHTLAMGFKLFCTLLIARLCIEMVNDFIKVSTLGSFMDLMVILAALLAFALLLATLPKTLAAIVSMTSAFSPGTQIAAALRTVSRRAIIQEPLGAVGGVISGNALAKAQGHTGAKRLGMGALNTLSGYGEATANQLTGNVRRESQARKSMGQRASYLLQQRKYDLKRGYKSASEGKESGGPPPASGGRGSGRSTTEKAASAEGRDGGY